MGILQFSRDRNPKNPGDYFLFPGGAYGISLSNSEFNDITTTLKSYVIPSMYNLFVLANLKGYYYELGNGNVKRREFRVRFAKSDTIYVISGWLGKLISFYRCIPGNYPCNAPHLASVF